MKKSLIALAVAGVVSAPAFAATSNVDVYGVFNMAVSLVDDQPTGVNDIQVTSQSSRFGLKGSEDLGGGLSAIWQVESSLNLDEQSGTLAGRNSFVGVKGGFGTVLLGNHDTPLKMVGRSVDLFGDGLADSRNVMGGGSDTRADNVVAYVSPSFSGLTLSAAYTTDFNDPGGNNGEAEDRDAYNLSATYANGPLYLGLGFGDGNGHETAGLGKHWRLAAGYTFGNFKVVGQYDSLEDDTPAVGNGDYDAWMLGASYTMGNIVLKANYMDGDFDATGAADPSQWTIGADYNMSKRTTLFALYVSGENVTLGGGAGLADRIAGAAVAGDDDISAFSVGVRHAF